MSEAGASSAQAKPEDARRTGTAHHTPSHTAASSLPTKRRSSRRIQPSQADASKSTVNAPSTSLANLPIHSRGLVDDRRAKLAQTRTEDLRVLYSEHDSLVREAFHLENFVTMIGYDPEDAKQDDSNVYHEFESEFDLSEVVSAEREKGRKTTRHRANQNAELLASLAAKATTRSVSKVSDVVAPPPTEVKWEVRTRDRRSSAANEAGPSHGSASHHTNGVHSNGHKPSRLVLPQTAGWSTLSPPSSPLTPSVSSASHSSPLVLPMKRPRPIELDPRFAKVKRIRLTVKIPPAEYTSPDQRPSKPKFGRSVDTYLNSYVCVEDAIVTVPELEEEAQRDAKLYDRIAALRREGRLPTHREVPQAPPTSVEPTRPMSHWDMVLSHVGLQMKRVYDDVRIKQSTARRLSRAVVAHFERIAQAEDRERQTEEKRLRALAKFTVKEVMKKWRDAINHVREVKLLQEKEELARQGKKQLNAILEQSSQVLEAQHLDLARTRRSRSVSTPVSWTGSRSISRSDGETDYGSEEEEESRESVEEDEAEEEEDPFTASAEESGVQIGLRHYSSTVDHHLPEHAQLLDDLKMSARYSPQQPSLEGADDGTSTDMDNISVEHMPSNGSRRAVVNGQTLTGGSDFVLVNGHSARSQSVHIRMNGEVGDVWQSEGDGTGSHIRDSVPPDAISGNLPEVSPRSMSREEDDPDFLLDSRENLEDQDREMAQAMEDEEEHDGNSDAELEGLQVDADVPIDVLLRRYGYAHPAEGVESDDESDTATYEERIEHATAAGRHLSDEPIPVEAHAEKLSSLDVSTLSSPNVIEESVAKPEEDRSVFPAIKANIMGQNAERRTSDTDLDDEELHSREASLTEEDGAESVEEDLPPGEAVDGRVRQPFLLRGTLRPYQHAGLEWLVSLYNNGLNGILADEMGLGKTIQTIALLAHLACDRGIWGPHLIIVPTSVLLNWEMEFKRFLPGFKILTYYGSIKERKEKRHGWNTEFHFNVCITSYQLVLADQHIFRRKQWRYMILDEAHNIKNFRSQRWQTLLGFHSQRRLLLTGTPLQNNLMELWSLLYFLMPSGLSEEFSGGTFAGQKQFAEWFSNPMDKAIGNTDSSELDEETLETVNKLHTLLRPYILRRMKSEVEKQLPAKYEHIVECRLSKRQRLLYDEFMQRASTRETLATGSFLSVVNLLMQLRKICNHPDLFEVRPILTSFAIAKSRSAIADFEIKELLLRRRLLADEDSAPVNLHTLGMVFTSNEGSSPHVCRDTQRLDAGSRLPFIGDLPEEPPPHDTSTITGFNKHNEWVEREDMRLRWRHAGYLNALRCAYQPVYGFELLRQIRKMHYQVVPLEEAERNRRYSLRKLDRVHAAVHSYEERASGLASTIDQFAFATPAAVALDLPEIALTGLKVEEHRQLVDPAFDTLHNVSVKLQIAFPEARLLQYDCGKLQELAVLLRERKAGNHRVLIFTQMTRVLDILEIFLNLHGYRYLRLDGATKVEQRQLITERYNADARIFAFIASSRSGGVGINLTGADTVIFYDSDFNPAMDRQCEDRAHRIGQTRDVHIYRFITKHTIEENMLLTANHKRALDDVVIRQGDFDWRKILVDDLQMEQALAQVEDQADAEAARVALNEEREDVADFEDRVVTDRRIVTLGDAELEADEVDEEDVGGTTIDYMVSFVERDWEYFVTF